MTARGLALVLISALLTVAANLLMRSGIDRAGGFPGRLAELPPALLRLVNQPHFDIGFVLYGVAALVWFRVVASEPLSTAYPLLVSLTFIMVSLGAVYLFHEPMTWRKVIGLGVILVGVFVLRKG